VKSMPCEHDPKRRLNIRRSRNLVKYAVFFWCCLLCFLSACSAVNAQDERETTVFVQVEDQANSLPWLGLILCACFLLAGKHVYRRLWRNSMSARDAQQLRETRRRALQELAALDETYASGQLDAQLYTRERTRRKRRLVELTTLERSLRSHAASIIPDARETERHVER